ncbi:MAG: hypothetical protein QOG68_2295 [Solirubrobacteraceae bacterium]|nr:hypothetical protein [Solirubrobacteraceae bacterium]
MSHRMPLIAATLAGLALAVPAAHASYLPLAGAPGYGPAQYAFVQVDKVGSPTAKHVLVLIPGTFAGSGSFGIVAKALTEQVPDLQVWSIDRRPNQFEDTSYMVKALKGEITSKQLFDYYLGWIGDSSIQPHYVPLDDANYGFARTWGLKLAMEDTRRVVLAARKGGRKVILGGHSLGGSSVLDYAAWDFAGRPGYKDLTGLVLIDGGGVRPAVSLATVKKEVGDLSTSSPWLDLLGINLPWTSGVFQETGALGAINDPDAPSIGQASPLLPAEFKPAVPVTNKALFGNAFDYRSSPKNLGLIQIHSGHVNTQDAEPHGWVDDGITPIESFARLAAHEPGNFIEWYYPKRLTIDVGAAGALVRNKATDFLGLRVWHAKDVNLPLYAFQTSLSHGQVLKGTRTFIKRAKVPFSVLVDRSKTYSHLDPLAATPSKNAFLKTVVPFLKRLR